MHRPRVGLSVRYTVSEMLGRHRSGVFLSYARADGEAFAERLRKRLRSKAPDIEIKQDSPASFYGSSE